MSKPDKLSDGERKVLARLARKHGTDEIVRALQEEPQPLNPGGRPPSQDVFELIHLAQVFEDMVREFREAGSRTPVLDAEREFFDMDPDNGHTDKDTGRFVGRLLENETEPHLFEAYRAKLEKKRLRGAKLLAKWRGFYRAYRAKLQSGKNL